jgi:hypothetical protein
MSRFRLSLVERRRSLIANEHDDVFVGTTTIHDHQAQIRRRAPTRHSIKSLPGRKSSSNNEVGESEKKEREMNRFSVFFFLFLFFLFLFRVIANVQGFLFSSTFEHTEKCDNKKTKQQKNMARSVSLRVYILCL